MKSIKKAISILSMSIIFASQIYSLNIERVCNLMAAHPITIGEFTQIKTVNSAKGKRELKSFGNFIFSVDGLMWKTTKPFPSTMTVGKNYVVQTGADGKRNVIDTSDNQVFGSIADTLTSVFSNDLTNLQKNFYTDFTDLGNGDWEIALKPKDGTIAAVLNTLTLSGTVDSDSVTLSKMVLTESADSTITYLLANQKYPKELSDDEKANFIVK